MAAALRVLNATGVRKRQTTLDKFLGRLPEVGWMMACYVLLLAESEPADRSSPTGSPGSPTGIWR